MNTLGPIGSLIDNRTYRRLTEEGCRETISQRNKRVSDYSLSLLQNAPNYQQIPETAIQEEYETLLEGLNNIEAWASGRTMWAGGAQVNPVAQFNCSALAINSVKSFGRIFHLLSCGVGVGFRVFERDTSQLPTIKNKSLILDFLPYEGLPKSERLEETSLEIFGEHNHAIMKVGDSRLGWHQAIDHLVEILLVNPNNLHSLTVNLNSVRPMGERLMKFGGRASGPEALQVILSGIHAIVSECPSDKLRPIDCMDMACVTAKGVVAGNTRRSALICIFDEGDNLCARAKVGLYTDPALYGKRYREQSNNTMAIGSKRFNEMREFLCSHADLNIEHPEVKSWLASFTPTRAFLADVFKSVEAIGEPGFCNYARMVALRFFAARNWRTGTPEELFDTYCSVCTNPCHEIILSVGSKEEQESMVGLCNLTTLPLPNFIKAGHIDYTRLENSIKIITRIGVRQTLVNIPEDYANILQQRERLLGVSITGWQDAFQVLGWSPVGPEASSLRGWLRDLANEEATRYSAELGIPRPLLVTTIKPEGTASTIFGTSSGIHWDYSPYYLRRVRMAGNDGLSQVLGEQGYPWYPEIDELDNLFSNEAPRRFKWLPKFLCKPKTRTIFDKLALWEKEPIGKVQDYKTVVFVFPVKSISSEGAEDVSAYDQLENVKAFSLEYADHMVSSTVTVKDHEWGSCIYWLVKNWAEFTNASFLKFFAVDQYPLLPMEACTKEVYEEALNRIPAELKQKISFDRTQFIIDEALLAQKDQELNPQELELEDTKGECRTGACPIR